MVVAFVLFDRFTRFPACKSQPISASFLDPTGQDLWAHRPAGGLDGLDVRRAEGIPIIQRGPILVRCPKFDGRILGTGLAGQLGQRCFCWVFLALTCFPAGPSFITRACEFVMCYPTRPQPLSEFPAFDQAHGLAACADFISSAGTLFPMAPCGRSSL